MRYCNAADIFSFTFALFSAMIQQFHVPLFLYCVFKISKNSMGRNRIPQIVNSQIV